jgi:hypothetical protein
MFFKCPTQESHCILSVTNLKTKAYARHKSSLDLRRAGGGGAAASAAAAADNDDYDHDDDSKGNLIYFHS